LTQSAQSNAQYLNQLVLQVAQHNEPAYLELFESCGGRLKAYAIKCGSNPSDAEDLVQDCMLTVWNKAPQFNPKAASAMTWMYTIIRNRRIDLLRKEKPNLIQSFDLWPDGDFEQAYSDQFTSSQLDDDVDSDLNVNLVRILIESLPEEQRQIVYKVYFEGKSHSEISLDLNLPLGTIKSRLRLAMKKLDTLAKEQMTWLIIILLTNF
jgi:RNA polymerase sigma-70 factor (ECF subfamily)